MDSMACMLIFGSLGSTEILIIVGGMLLLFGGRKIPELARGLGKGISEFKRGIREESNDKPDERRPTEPNDKP